MSQIFLERRRCRSSNYVEALRLYLGAIVERASLKALVLADTDGLVVAEAHEGEGKMYEPEVIASSCPLVVRVGGNSCDGTFPIGTSERTSILLFLYLDQPLYLVAVGDTDGLSAAMLGAVGGIQRILAPAGCPDDRVH